MGVHGVFLLSFNIKEEFQIIKNNDVKYSAYSNTSTAEDIQIPDNTAMLRWVLRVS